MKIELESKKKTLMDLQNTIVFLLNFIYTKQLNQYFIQDNKKRKESSSNKVFLVEENTLKIVEKENNSAYINLVF